jgi:hypothetical protein
MEYQLFKKCLAESKAKKSQKNLDNVSSEIYRVYLKYVC